MNTRDSDTNNSNLSFIDWLPSFERTQEIQNQQISDLVKSVSALVSAVETLKKQQSALFGRTDRPYPWAALVGGITLIVLGAGLLIAPIKTDLNDQHIFDNMVSEHIVQSAEDRARNTENIRWQEKSVDRLYSRVYPPTEYN